MAITFLGLSRQLSDKIEIGIESKTWFSRVSGFSIRLMEMQYSYFSKIVSLPSSKAGMVLYLLQDSLVTNLCYIPGLWRFANYK